MLLQFFDETRLKAPAGVQPQDIALLSDHMHLLDNPNDSSVIRSLLFPLLSRADNWFLSETRTGRRDTDHQELQVFAL
jgi:hypothetical protein